MKRITLVSWLRTISDLPYIKGHVNTWLVSYILCEHIWVLAITRNLIYSQHLMDLLFTHQVVLQIQLTCSTPDSPAVDYVYYPGVASISSLTLTSSKSIRWYAYSMPFATITLAAISAPVIGNVAECVTLWNVIGVTLSTLPPEIVCDHWNSWPNLSLIIHVPWTWAHNCPFL